ncbi:hypothetical protein Mgra_00007606 [Meloidogyne graminicola]|uniref:Uncharacterized protein n=1 Tax=Meloidogyne graminicola TaxID=189291 RepID=A0A8S9ZI52_9BILA|nr:hypothetical protein Mgra_00007606 [Meloidogyne graminicola]
MEVEKNSESKNNIIEIIPTVEGDPNEKEPSSSQQNEVGDEIIHIEAPELEMREEVNASPTIQEGTDIQIIKNIEKDNISLDQPIQSTVELKKIVLTQGQLKLLATTDPSTFRNIVIGCFVRVHIPGLPLSYSDRVFTDQIVDITEPLSYQHLWIDRRFRLRFLGDFELENIVGLQIQDDVDLRSWFDCMEAKYNMNGCCLSRKYILIYYQGESTPSLGFVSQKSAELKSKLEELSSKQKELAKKPTFTRSNLAQIALNPSTLRSLAKLGFERFSQVVKGCFVLMPAIRKNKPNDCQYHIVRVIDCVEGHRDYKIKNMTKINFHLVLPFYGRYKIKWMKNFSTVTEQGFRNWIEDMHSWDEKLPTLDEIQNKAAELQLALTEAERLPSIIELEKKVKDEEEKAKRAKLPVSSAKDLEPCFITREQLQKLSNIEYSDALVKLLIGCFVRLTSSGGSETGFELDKIMNAKLNEQRKNRQADILLELKFMGTVSLTALNLLVSTTKPNEKEFKEWAKKNEGDEEDPLPLNEFVTAKSSELIKILGNSKESVQSNQSSNISNGSISIPDGKIKKEVTELNKNLLHKSSESTSKELFFLQTKDGKLTAVNFRKCLISMNKIFDMMSWDKETLARVIKGFFIRIGERRPEKSSKLQFYVDQITGVSWGGTPYKIRGNVLTDLRLHLKNLNVKTLQQLYRTSGDGFNDDSLMIFGEDMKNWRRELPTLNFIDSKNREYINAVSKYYKFDSKSLFTRKDPREMSFLGGRPQQLLKQVVSSVRTTPGMGQSWKESPLDPKFTPIFPSSKPVPLLNFNNPRTDEGTWKQQTTSTVSSNVNKIHQLNDFRLERESWNQNFTSNDFDDNFVPKNRFGSPTSALQQQYNDSYLPAKRARLSPEPPPVHRLF